MSSLKIFSSPIQIQSSFLFSSPTRFSSFPSSLYFPTKNNANNCRLRARAFNSPENNDTNDSKPPNGTLPKGRREILLEYVKTVQPEFMELFVKKAPQQVVEAMRQTVTNMIGTLPPQFFAVTVTTVAENLAQLMYSVLMTGYMFRNAQYRLELQQSLEQVALPDVKEIKDVPDFAPGTQKKVTGEVIRWNNISGIEKIDAVKYIELLEAEIEELNRQVTRRSTNGQNELLEYLKSLEPQNIKTIEMRVKLAELKGLKWLLATAYSCEVWVYQQQQRLHSWKANTFSTVPVHGSLNGTFEIGHVCIGTSNYWALGPMVVVPLHLERGRGFETSWG
ncbi:hypothetical protein GIB67_006940 [Kingdonia uniflora]|uniref:Uncharacterized protein n=1 Tax=Kingdonia uniflora TaxID=39325 RepID=A0A7J7NZ25_9MAGN|nr:hypothetical protein GIB67_006940 [Kingdonia uniflora]